MKNKKEPEDNISGFFVNEYLTVHSSFFILHSSLRGSLVLFFLP